MTKFFNFYSLLTIYHSLSSKSLSSKKAHGDVDEQDERHQNKRRSPCLRVPFIVRRYCVVVNLNGQACYRLIQRRAKESAAEGREKQRRSFAGHASDRKHSA